MATRTATQQRTRCRGYIDPCGMYTTEGCMRYAGIGRMSLIEARASGIVKPIPVGNRIYYRGSDLIAWIESHAEEEE
jgi:hypothetical protein